MRIDFQRRVDRLVGVPLCRLLSLVPGAGRDASDAPAPARILVILLSEMGSLVLAQPMFSRLRERYPEAKLYALVFDQNKEVLELLEAMPASHILVIRNRGLGSLIRDGLVAVRKLRRLGIDTAIDCELFSRVSALLSYLSGARRRVGFHRHTQEGLYRGDFINRPVLYNPYHHIAQQFVHLAEAVEGESEPLVKRDVVSPPGAPPPMAVRAGELEAVREQLESDFPQIRGARLVVVHPGGGLLPIRAWPLSSFQEVVGSLVDCGFVVAITGLAGDKVLARQIQSACGVEHVIDLTGYTRTVRELMLIFHFAELLITNDGGPGHFASMTPVPSIVLYGPETPVLYGSLDPDSVPLYQGFSCSPCLTAYNHRNSPCDGDNQCLKTISPRRVVDEALAILGRKGGGHA